MLCFNIKFNKKKLTSLCEKKKELLKKLHEIENDIENLVSDSHLEPVQSPSSNC